MADLRSEREVRRRLNRSVWTLLLGCIYAIVKLMAGLVDAGRWALDVLVHAATNEGITAHEEVVSTIVQPVRRAMDPIPDCTPRRVHEDVPHRYYAVAVGRIPGVYTSWRDAADQVLGYPGNRHQAFRTLREAEYFVGR